MSDDVADHPKWTSIAADALQRVNYATHGKKNAALQTAVDEYGLSANHIRRMMRALTFTTEIQAAHPELSRALQGVTFKVPELIDRWYQRDQAAAIDAAERYVTRRLSFRALLEEYGGQSKRAAARDADKGLGLDLFRAAALRRALQLIGVEVEEATRTSELKQLSGIDHFLQERAGRKRWAVVVVLPGQSAPLYRARRELDLGRALALRQLEIEPIFVLPEVAGPDDFQDLLAMFDAGFAHIAVVKVRATYV